jgi:putative membrane protein
LGAPFLLRWLFASTKRVEHKTVPFKKYEFVSRQLVETSRQRFLRVLHVGSHGTPHGSQRWQSTTKKRSYVMRTTAMLAGACLMFVAHAHAQSPSNPPPTNDFVNKVADSDMFEIQSSKLALQKHPDRHTRPFASKMVKDHTKTSKQLQSLVTSGKMNAELPTTLDPDHQKKLDELRGLNGKQFDEAYDKAQLEGHEEAVGLFRTYAQNGDNEDLKRWAAKTLPHLEHHLAMAEKLQ